MTVHGCRRIALGRCSGQDGRGGLTRSICRAVTHLDHAPFDIRRFIDDMLTFDHQTRRRWMFEYYGTRLDVVGEAHATSHSDKGITA